MANDQKTTTQIKCRSHRLASDLLYITDNPCICGHNRNMDVLSRCFRAHCLNLTVLFVPYILSQLQAQCPILMELVWWKMSCCVKSPEVKLPSEFTQDSQLETIMNKRWICCLALTVADLMVCLDYKWQSNRLKFIFSWSGWHAATNWPPALVAEWRERRAINQIQ